MVDGGASLESVLLPGARALLAQHQRELPQRDDLCGAFCGALALHAAGLHGTPEEPLDQDAVALAAGSVVSAAREPGTLPHGELGRRDYRLTLPGIDDSDLSGTTAAGVVSAVAELAGGELETIPYAGPWTSDSLAAMFAAAAACSRPVTLIANLATHHLWGGKPSPTTLLDYLYEGKLDGPPPDWDVGHFACIVARTSGPAGSLYAVADTYAALGSRGVHLQPEERLAAAIDRRDKPAGGIIVVGASAEAARLRASAEQLGLREELWDNGTVVAEAGV
jgi:hypothetical protein